MKKVLLTGADGMLGNHIVRELIQRNYQVVALVEPRMAAMDRPGWPGVTVVEGDILKADQLSAAFRGCDAVIHAAADTTTWPPRSPGQWKINHEGTLNVISATLAAGMEKMVHVGSASSFGYGTRESPGDETRPYRFARFGLDYMDSKRAAHEAVLDAVETKGLPATIVNPTYMFGAFDRKPGSGTMIVFVNSKKTLRIPPGGRNFVYAGDVATGIANALERGRIGEACILGNQNMNYQEIFTLIARVIGKPEPHLFVLSPIMKTYGAWMSLRGWWTGREPDVTYELAKISCVGQYYSPQKAIRELDLPQTSIKRAIIEAYEWMREFGVLAKKAPVASVKDEDVELVRKKIISTAY